MTVTPILIGGFGNRLYQLTNALRLCDKYNAELLIHNIETVPNDVPTYRKFILRESDFSDFGGHPLVNIDGLPATLSEVFPHLNFVRKPIKIQDIVDKKPLYFEKNINEIPEETDVSVMGYFFGYSFMKEHVKNLHWSMNPSISIYVKEKYPELLDKKVLGIHLRLGIGTDNFSAIDIPTSFYLDILERERNNYDEVFIITDNPSKAKVFIDGLNIPTPVRIIIDEPMYVDMMIMSYCYTLVVGCSTLSGWASYINHHNNIYVPQVWVRHHKTNDISPTWKII